MASASTCLRTTALSQGLAAGSAAEKECSVQRSIFLGSRSTPKNALRQKVSETRARVTCMAERKSKWASLKEEPKAEAPKKKVDRWGGLGTDMSDDQQDITRGRGMVDSVFQGASGLSGTQNAIMSSYDYISTAQRTLSNISAEGYYISPAFMDKLVIHITKNYLKLPNIKVPLILGVWGGKGQGKSFQAELVFSMLGINPIVMSAGELESGNAGEPAKLIRQRYREAADIIKKGKMCALFINDLDAGAGRMGNTTQYTVNNQMVNATLMNIADNPTNVQLPGVYNKEENPRVPIIVTGNDFSTLYAPLIRDGRMEKFYWAPTREDRIGVCTGIFKEDKISVGDIETLVDTFPGQSIDFFGALRSRVYDDLVRDWVKDVGYQNLGKSLVNSKSGPPTFAQPRMTLDILLTYGNKLVEEQENVKRVQFADEYLSGAALGNANADAIASGSFYAGKAAQQNPPKLREGCTDPNSKNFDPTARSDDGSCEYDFSTPLKKPEPKKEEQPAFSWDAPAPAKASEPSAFSWDAPAPAPEPKKAAEPSAFSWDNYTPEPEAKKAAEPKTYSWDDFKPAPEEPKKAAEPKTYSWDDYKPAPEEPKKAAEPSAFSWDSYTPEPEPKKAAEPTTYSWDDFKPAPEKAAEPEPVSENGGCTDPKSTNYNPSAIFDDGTCEYDMSTWPA